MWGHQAPYTNISPSIFTRNPYYNKKLVHSHHYIIPHHTWFLLNRFRTGQGPCHPNLHKWGLAQSPSCDCGQRQTMNHTVDTYPLTKFEGRLNLLHEVDDDAVTWLESTATAALVKWTTEQFNCYFCAHLIYCTKSQWSRRRTYTLHLLLRHCHISLQAQETKCEIFTRAHSCSSFSSKWTM